MNPYFYSNTISNFIASSINEVFGTITRNSDFPENWSNSVVHGKSYHTDDFIGENTWKAIESLIEKYRYKQITRTIKTILFMMSRIIPCRVMPE